MNRIDIINSLISQHSYKSYLEIGVRFKRDCFDHVQCAQKTSVDPSATDTYDFTMTSDEFFAQNKNSFDLVFIDGWHAAEQVIKDVNNALDCLSNNGTIVMHDCSPPDEGHTSLSLCGTVWKVIYWLRANRPDLIVHTVDDDYGVGIVRRGAGQLTPDFNLFFDYGVMAHRRQESLGLISAAEFRQQFLGEQQL